MNGTVKFGDFMEHERTTYCCGSDKCNAAGTLVSDISALLFVVVVAAYLLDTAQ